MVLLLIFRMLLLSRMPGRNSLKVPLPVIVLFTTFTGPVFGNISRVVYSGRTIAGDRTVDNVGETAVWPPLRNPANPLFFSVHSIKSNVPNSRKMAAASPDYF